MPNDDKVQQSPFEQAVVNIINYLFNLPKQARKFDHKKELLNALHIGQNNWGKFKSGTRHIPEHLHKHIREYLINNYDVNSSYLDGRNSKMFLKPPVVDDEPATYHKENKKELPADVAALKRELDTLQVLNKNLLYTIELQKKYIAELEAKDKKQEEPETPLTND